MSNDDFLYSDLKVGDNLIGRYSGKNVKIKSFFIKYSDGTIHYDLNKSNIIQMYNRVNNLKDIVLGVLDKDNYHKFCINLFLPEEDTIILI